MIVAECGRLKLHFELESDYAVLCSFEGSDSVLNIPKCVSENGVDYSVKKVKKKAFLGCNGLRTVTVPSTIEDIGDWAFAQCIHLNEVCFEANVLPMLGKNVFEGCQRLNSIQIETMKKEVSFLLASVVSSLPAAFLLRDVDTGSKEWLYRYDLSLISFLKQDDFEGFNNTALCGEEDISYDGIGSVDGELLGESSEYIKGVCKNKCKLAFLRLRFCEALSLDNESFLKDYINRHARSELLPAAWMLIKEEYRDDLEYLELYLNINKPDFDELDALIEDLGDDCPQAKSYLIKKAKKEDRAKQLFDDMLL